MVQPYIAQPDYTNAMVKGLSANLAFNPPSKGGGMRGGGGGKKEKSVQEKDRERRDKEEVARTKENVERNALYKAQQQEESNTNALAQKAVRAEEKDFEEQKVEKKKAFIEQWKGYSNAVTQDNYDDYLLFAKENGVELPGVATPEQAKQMQPDQFKEYMGNFFGGKKTTGESLEDKKAFERYKHDLKQGGTANKQPTETEKRQRMKLAVDAETKILNPENKSKVQLKGQTEFFNTYSKKPYMYIWNEGEKVPLGKGTLGLGINKKPSTEKIVLPVINGTQLTAEDVTFTAEQEGLTVFEVLKQIGAIE